tara:strand:- start:38786 stop:40084 length:1299 start_codon:yes stop_codon:yes gene_type:complete
MQAMAGKLGGKVSKSSFREFGYQEVNLVQDCPLLKNLETNKSAIKTWTSHGDRVESIPENFSIFASSSNAPIAGMMDLEKKYFGLQFHPEVTHTEFGKEIIENFVNDICRCPKIWLAENIIKDHIEKIKRTVGSEKVLLGLSGGVDSSVVAVLLNEAIGDQLTCVFVDNGLLRLNEGDAVVDMFNKNLGVKVIRVDAQDKFFTALSGVDDPEQKRKIIGKTFIDVFNREASKIKNVHWLAQGTIYPDVIESADSSTGKAHVIKSHHNVGGLPKDMKLKLIEPLRNLFKDEVRKIGIELGLNQKIVNRHPFPGPGLGVRILGEVHKEYADILRKADAVFIEELERQGLYDQVSQAFAVFLPVRSVGVMGDGRSYDYVIALRAVETVDFMTAKWSKLPFEFLDYVSTRIMNEVSGVSRVTYDISSKPPSTIEWE